MARLFTLLFSTTLLLVSLNIIAAVKLANENFDEYRLANGMSVIFSNLFYDDGLVRIDWNIHAGSAQELNELEGVAHLLEHSLFSISEYDSLFDYFHSLGGSVSAFTSLNGTSYRFKVKPKDVNRALEVIGLWQNIQAFNEDEHLKNQDIVLNEIQLKFNQYQSLPAYHFQNSPLLRKTVGVARDINQVSMADLKQYYQHWYHPKNTELFISGLKADAATIKKVEVFLNNKWTTKPNLAKEATLNFKQSTWDIFESKNEYDSIHANYYLKTDNKKYLIDLVYTQLLDEYLKSYAKLLIKNSDYFHEFRTSVITYPNYVIRYNANIYVTKNYTDESIKTLDLIIENIIKGKFDDSILESATQSLLKSSNISNNYTNYYESFRNFMDFESKKNRFKIKHDTLINLDKTKLSEIALKLVSEHYYGLIYSSEHKKRRSYNDINQYDELSM